LRPYSPGGVLIALTPAQKGSIPPTPSTHRLRLGLPGYLIPFAPLAFAPQCQTQSRKPPSPLVFLPISTHFTATLGIPLSSPALKNHSFLRITGLSPALLQKTYGPTYTLFTPNNSGQRSPPTYYRGCWHVVSRGFLLQYRHSYTLFTYMPFVLNNRALRPEGLLHSRGVAPSDFRPLRKIPHCCLP
jgi:hypothetical protein